MLIKYILLSVFVAVIIALIGAVFADIIAGIINVDRASAYVMAWGIYLCIVIIVCTGIILFKINDNK